MALRIGPVGPVREAGLGSGAGLGEVTVGTLGQTAVVRPARDVAHVRSLVRGALRWPSASLNRARTGVPPALPWNALGCVGVFSGGVRRPSKALVVRGAGGRRGRSVHYNPTSAGAQRSTQNWHGPGESDCLIKTKHCDGL